MKQNNTIMVEETNKDLEDWANEIHGGRTQKNEKVRACQWINI